MEVLILCVCPVCALCRLSDDDPAMFGEKVMLREHGFSVHYLCLVRIYLCILVKTPVPPDFFPVFIFISLVFMLESCFNHKIKMSC